MADPERAEPASPPATSEAGSTEARPSRPSTHAPLSSGARTAPLPSGARTAPWPSGANRSGSILPGAYLDRREPTPPVGDVTDLVDPGFLRRLLPRRLRGVHLGLASRTTIALALGALVVSVIVSLLTFVVARSSFVAERRRAAERLAFTNAAEAQQALAGRSGRSVSSVLRSQHRPGSSSSLLRSGSATYRSNDADVTIELVPVVLQRRLDASSRNPGNDTASGWQIARDGRGSRLVIGIRLPSVSATFYEISSLADLDRSLRNLGRALTLAALASTVGSAIVGRSVSRRVVRPLRNVATAAGDIASGRLETRLEITGDSDLDPLVTSFNDMAASLQTRIEREARFASDVSHELRTPLTALTAAVELLEGGRDELSERNQKIVDVLGNQSRHFRRLVLDLLEISRFDANAAELVVEVLDLPSFVQQLVVLQGSTASVDASGLHHPEVRLDKRRVERIVANYLQNAANYADGAVRVELRDSATVPVEIVSTSTILGPGSAPLTGEDAPEPPRRIIIAVEDRGPGIGAEDRDLLFERFRRGSAHQRGSGVKGTGLGLSLVAAHAQLHGGRAWVEERPGGGARFCAELVEP